MVSVMAHCRDIVFDARGKKIVSRAENMGVGLIAELIALCKFQ